MFIEIYCIRWKWFSWKVIHFGLKKLSFRSVTIKNGAMGKGMPSCTVLWEMLTRAFNQTNFWLIFFVFFASNNKQLQYGTFVHVVFYTTHCIYQTLHNTLYLPIITQPTLYLPNTTRPTLYLPNTTRHIVFIKHYTTHCIYPTLHNTLYLPNTTQHIVFTRQCT